MNPEWFAKCCVVLAQIVFGLVGTDGLNYLGCFKENSINDRLLKGATKEFRRSLTPEICLSYCKTKGMRYFGLQYSYECFCSIERPSFKKIADDNECNMKCEGNPRETCGGGLRLSVYDSEEDFSTVKYMGCYKERSVTARLMAGASKDFKGTLTNQLCIQFCREKGFSYAGTQYSFECFCTKERPHFKSAANEKDCNAPCDGNTNENCGGGLKLSVFDLYDKSTDHVYPNFLGCYENSNYQRNFLPNEEDYFKKLLTPEFCVGYCYRRGYRYAGMESGSSCYCASVVDATSKVNDLQCNIPCSGDKKFKCGGRGKLSVYHTEISDQSEEGRLLGCFEDSSSLRTLSGLETVFKETNTPRLCLNVCLQLGFKYAGVQYGYECFCGNRSPPRDLEKPESECSMKCPGDRLKMCGGGWRLLIFNTGGGSSSKPSAAVVTQPAIILTAATERPYTLTTTTTTTRRPSTLLTNAQTVRPTPNTKPQMIKPVLSQKPHTVRPTASNYPSTGSNKPSKPSHTRPSHTVVSQKPTPNLTSPQSSLTTKPPKPQATTWRPQTEQQTTLQQQTPWDNSKPQQQSSWENNKPQPQQQSSWENNKPQPQQQSSWENNKPQPQQQSSWENNKPQPQQQSSWENKKPQPQQQSPWENNKPQPQQQSPWENNKPQQQTPWDNNKQPQQTTLVTTRPPLQSTRPGNTDQLTTWGNTQPFQGGSTIQSNGRPQQQPALSTQPFQGGSTTQNNGRPQQQSPSSIKPQTQGIVNTQQSGSFTPVSNPPTKMPNKPTCLRSVTEVRGENACQGQKIFHDDFSDSPNIDPYKWTHEAIMPWTPDYEFVVYTKNDTTSFIKNGRLYIKPSLFADDFVKRGTLDLESCTGLLHSEECRRQGATFNIIPPVQSARITTKESLSFKYGRIDIRAKLPVGDWIVPEIWMEPKRKDYGSGAFASGRVRIAMARGNEILEYDGRDIGNRQLEVGILMGVGENIRARTIIRDKADGWWRSFHNYSLVWTPDNLQFLVDGQHQESLASPGRPLYQLAGFDEELGQTWRHGSHIAPFDKEFYITLGLSVGGMRDFPDECRSANGHEKPWRNMAVKAMASFWEDRRIWQRTWNDEDSSLKIAHVTVTAL